MNKLNNSRELCCRPWLLALSLLAIWLGALLPAAAASPITGTNTESYWTGNGVSTNASWTNAANWLPFPSVNPVWVAPPLNPQTVTGLGAFSGSLDFQIDGYSHADIPWTMALLYFAADITNSFGMDGADLHIYGSAVTTSTISQAAVAFQAGAGATAARTINITNNIFFDDTMFQYYGGTTNYASAPSASLIFGNNAAFTGNFYGNVTLTNPAMSLYVRGPSPVNFYGKVSAPTTNLYVDPVYGLTYNVVIASTGSGPGPVSFYNSGNTWSNLWFDLGTINLGIANALPTNSMMHFATASRAEALDLRGFDQTLLYISETAGTTAAHSITDSLGTGRLTLNDNGVTNDWSGIVMSGGVSLVKNGNGTLIMERDQTYTGSTTINAGVLQLGIGAAAGSLGSSSVVTNNGTLIVNNAGFSLMPSLYGPGGLQVLGSGGLYLNGTYDYSGPTTIANGPLTLSANGVFKNTSAITLANTAAQLNASMGVLRSSGQSLTGNGTVIGDVVAGPGSTVTVGNSIGTLTLSGNATFDTATINMELGSDPTTIGGTVNDLISVSGGLTLTNVSTVYVTPLAALSTTGDYTLMQGSGGIFGYASNLNVTLPYSPGRYLFTVQDPAGTSPNLQVGVTAFLVGNLLWRGANPSAPTVWDANLTTNWLNGGAADKFLNHDPVVFDDTALTNRATLVGGIAPSSLIMSNNAKAYVFDGAGSLDAFGALTVYGSGSLALSNTAANSFAGGITMEGGSVTVASSGAQSLGAVTLDNGSSLALVNAAADTLGAVTLNGTSLLTVANNGANTFGSINVASGTLAFNQPTDASVSAPIAGTGIVAKNGTNTLTLAADNLGFTGTLQINNGVLKATVNNSLGDGACNIASGASLDFDNPNLNTLMAGAADVTVLGPGFGSNGAIYGTGNYQAYALLNITLAGDTSFGGGWEGGVDAGAGAGVFTGNGYKLTKVGPETDWTVSSNQNWIGTGSDTGIGDIEVKAGLFAIEAASTTATGTTLGDPTKTATVRSNATLGFYRISPQVDKQIVLDDGASIFGGGGAAVPNPVGGTMSVNGTNHAVFWAIGHLLTYNGSMFGTGTMCVDRTPVGTLILGGTNSNTGGFFVKYGALRVANSLSLSSNLTVVVETNGLSGTSQVVGNNVPRVELSDGVVIPSGVTVHLNAAGVGDQRSTFGVATATAGNEYQGTLIPHGDGSVCLVVNNAASGLTISGPITNLDFVGTLNLRGPGQCLLSGPIRIGGNLGHNPSASGVFIISSTGNQWINTSIDGASTRLMVSNHNALCVTAPVYLNSGTLDLGGFNQTVPSLFSASGSQLGSSGTNTDSVLTINGDTNTSTVAGPIVDSVAGGTRTVALTITNTTVQLDAANTYTGPTLVENGGTLGGTGSLVSAVTVQSGGALAPGASIGTLSIANTLNLNAGSTSRFEIDAGTLAHDEVAGLTNVTYGGTLVISNTSATPLAEGQSFKLFDSTAYNTGSSFAAIVPAAPGPGLLWDTSNLTVDGTLKVISLIRFTAISQVGSQNFQFTIAGPIGTNYSVVWSTNVTIPLLSWHLLSSGTITISPFTVNDTAATNAERFYRISIP